MFLRRCFVFGSRFGRANFSQCFDVVFDVHFLLVSLFSTFCPLLMSSLCVALLIGIRVLFVEFACFGYAQLVARHVNTLAPPP